MHAVLPRLLHERMVLGMRYMPLSVCCYPKLSLSTANGLCTAVARSGQTITGREMAVKHGETCDILGQYFHGEKIGGRLTLRGLGVCNDQSRWFKTTAQRFGQQMKPRDLLHDILIYGDSQYEKKVSRLLVYLAGTFGFFLAADNVVNTLCNDLVPSCLATELTVALSPNAIVSDSMVWIDCGSEVMENCGLQVLGRRDRHLQSHRQLTTQPVLRSFHIIVTPAAASSAIVVLLFTHEPDRCNSFPLFPAASLGSSIMVSIQP